MNEQEQREITHKILEALYDGWECQTVISLDNVQEQGKWSKRAFRVAVNDLERHQGLIKSAGSSYTYKITAQGIIDAEVSTVVPIEKKRRHDIIRQHIISFLTNLYKREGSRADASFIQIAESLPFHNNTDILINLSLLRDLGNIDATSINSFRITEKGLTSYYSTEVDQQVDRRESLTSGSDSADIFIVWDPMIVNKEDYASLILALGDLVRSEGGIGVERIGHLGFGILVSEGTLV